MTTVAPRAGSAPHADADLDRGLGAGLEHGAATREPDALLHRHRERGHVTLDARAGLHLDPAQGADVPVHAPEDERVFHLHVGAHDAVLADLQALAVQDVALELAVDPQRAAHHERAAEVRVHADDGVRGHRIFRLWLWGSELEHM